MNGSPATTMVAQRLIASAMTLLSEIRMELQRLRELAEGADRYNYLGAGSTQGGNATLGTAPVTILEANQNRAGLSVQNLSAAGGANISIGIGNRYPAINTGITLLPGGSWDGRLSGRICQASITLVASASGASFSFVESV
jgi:hypothetical protein